MECPLHYSWSSLVAQLVKNPLATHKTWVWPPGWEDPLEKGKATHSSVLASRILYSPWVCKESDTTERLSGASYEGPGSAVGERWTFLRDGEPWSNSKFKMMLLVAACRRHRRAQADKLGVQCGGRWQNQWGVCIACGVTLIRRLFLISVSCDLFLDPSTFIIMLQRMAEEILSVFVFLLCLKWWI